ncbi:hypothetical protein GCM10007385_15030 [Tateyamaria omphalii]|uniref:class I SAM-dependent methyltransferase n=1 Tax=Tateyamaria omphalii TaxID=299262 RepID=UPI00167280DA|nr:class I SAM-dependent methyltransferase [Tateyamaria omphalii]GGX48197.1 hypothetical protein GCM10007385_15030 [Tateyamaria omphalii]
MNTHDISQEDWHEIYVAHAEGERTDLIPFPPEDIQVITNGHSGKKTAKGAIDIWTRMQNDIAKVRQIAPEWNVLDYGCGWGRMTRLIRYNFPNGQVCGVDTHPKLIESANGLLPDMQHKVVESMGPIPFGDGMFDLVFANSVFSHLSEPSAEYTLKEIGRKLKPGGIAVISVLTERQMESFYTRQNTTNWITRILGPRKDADKTLAEKGFVWGDTGRWDNYGIAITSQDWLHKLFDEAGLDLSPNFHSQSGGQVLRLGVKR